jgi:hypothetical protein
VGNTQASEWGCSCQTVLAQGLDAIISMRLCCLVALHIPLGSAHKAHHLTQQSVDLLGWLLGMYTSHQSI